jgi:enoyl-CoA hydratase
MSHRFIRLTAADGIGWLEFDRPPVNAFDWAMLREVAPALDALQGDPAVRVIVLASARERWFSSGADLAVFAEMRGPEMREWVELCHGVVGRLCRSEKPILAAIHGTAVGGGLEMTLHADLRFAAADARLGQPEIRIGMIPPVGATQALARLLGRTKAIRLLYEGELMSAAEAEALGLVDVVVPPAELRAAVTAYAGKLVERPAVALAAIRRSVTDGAGVSFAEGLAIERDWAVRLAETEDFREGVRAFLEKRKPAWRHR